MEEVCRHAGILFRPVVVLAFPKGIQLGRYYDQEQTGCMPCTTRRVGHFEEEWGTVTVEIGIASGMRIVQPWDVPKRVCIECPWVPSSRARHVQGEHSVQHPTSAIDPLVACTIGA